MTGLWVGTENLGTIGRELWNLDMDTMSSVRNRYWVLRHGKSIPNEKGLIVSSMENGTRAEFQLASEGVQQAEMAGELFLKELKANNIPLENAMEDLRERFFGPSLELTSHDKYQEIWALDEIDPFMQPDGGESVNDVASRLSKAMATMESEFLGCAMLIVSHGDTLQILQTLLLNAVRQSMASSGNDLAERVEAVRVSSILSQHRKFALLTGELRAVYEFGNASLGAMARDLDWIYNRLLRESDSWEN